MVKIYFHSNSDELINALIYEILRYFIQRSENVLRTAKIIDLADHIPLKSFNIDHDYKGKIVEK